jgi:hypothetical protein
VRSCLKKTKTKTSTHIHKNWWLTPIILATQEAEIRKIAVQGQLTANNLRYPISKITRAK